MKKIAFIFTLPILAVIAFIVVVFGAYIIVLNTDVPRNLISYNDLTIYKNNDYEDLNPKIRDVAEIYLPKYDSFEFKDYVNQFYVFDGSKTLFAPGISIVLELKFNDNEKYEAFWEYEKSRINYTDQYEISKNEYRCYLADEEDLLFVAKNAERPYKFCILCENEKEKTVRYVIFYALEIIEVDEKFDDVFKFSNCDWN